MSFQITLYMSELDLLIHKSLHHFRNASTSEIVSIFLGVLFLSSLFPKHHPRVKSAKVHGSTSWWEPTFWLQVRFVTQAANIIESGYNKFKDAPFVVRRYDTDITVLPIKYLEEMRLVPRNKLNGKKAQVNNLVPRWTWTQVMMESDLHVRVLNSKLNPELKKYVEVARSELEYAWKKDVPQPEEWTEVDIQQSMRMIVARMSAKIFLGEPACRNADWLKISIDFTFDMFVAAFTLRWFPPILHPIVAPFIPARWRIRKQMKIAKRIVGSLMEEYREKQRQGIPGQDTLLEWMHDNSNDNERSIAEMAARQCVLTLASIHTTSLSVANMLFDLCQHPEWFAVLREELDSVVEAYGMPGEKMETKPWLQKLEKMDSCFVESQRLTPPILLNPQRIALVPITLKDGTIIPKGARVAWAGHHRANDPDYVHEPNTFDPMRNYRKRHAGDSSNRHKFTAGQTDVNSLSFGYGGQSCPGRYFAVGEILLMMTRLLLEFEFKYPEGKTRPKLMHADENVFIDMKAKLMMRKRKLTP